MFSHENKWHHSIMFKWTLKLLINLKVVILILRTTFQMLEVATNDKNALHSISVTRIALACYNDPLFKDGLSLKIKNLHIHLYFIATQYLWKYALVDDIDNWTRSYILIIIYWNCPK